jgi:hypothetical protein
MAKGEKRRKRKEKKKRRKRKRKRRDRRSGKDDGNELSTGFTIASFTIST